MLPQDLDPKRAYNLYRQARDEDLVPAVDAVNHVMCLLAGLGEPGMCIITVLSVKTTFRCIFH